ASDGTVEAQRIGIRVIAPAVFLEVVDVAVVAPTATAAAVLRIATEASEGAAIDLRTSALGIETILHLQRQGAAQRVQTEHGVGPCENLHRVDRRERDQVPVDRVAEGFVDAHAVLVNGKTLRQPEERGGGEAAEVDVGLQRIVLGI